MKLETKYNIGDRIWVVYEPIINNQYIKDTPAGEVSVYDDYIDTIDIDKDGIRYLLKYSDYTDAKEEDIILYNDTDKLINKIKELMNEINKREGLKKEIKE